MPAEIIVNDEAVIRMLNGLAQRAKDLRPVMSEIGEIILSSVEKNFKSGGRYLTPGSYLGGPRKWDPLASSTIRQRKRRGKWPGQILVMTAGGLAASISKSVRNDSVAVGTNKQYAAIHQFGGTIEIAARSELFQRKRFTKGPGKGRFKKGTAAGRGFTRGAHKIRIPARPYLVVQAEDLTEIRTSLAEYLLKGVN